MNEPSLSMIPPDSALAPRKWYPPRLNRDYAELTNTFYGTTPISIADGGQLVWAPFPHQTTEYLLRCDVGSLRLSFGMCSWPTRWFDVRSLQVSPSAEEVLAIYEAAAHDFLSEFEALLGQPIVCLQLERSCPTPPNVVGFVLHGGGEIETIRGWVSADDVQVLLAAKIERSASNELPIWAERIPVDASLTVGRIKVGASDIATLQLGDLIRLDAAADDLLRPAAEFWPNHATRCVGVVYDNQFFLEKVMNDDYTPSIDDRELQSPTIDLLEVPITLSFEVGRITRPLSDFSRLAAGSSIDIGCRTPELRVRILANGKMIGTGELVDINDEAAVLITELSGH